MPGKHKSRDAAWYRDRYKRRVEKKLDQNRKERQEKIRQMMEKR